MAGGCLQETVTLSREGVTFEGINFEDCSYGQRIRRVAHVEGLADINAVSTSDLKTMMVVLQEANRLKVRQTSLEKLHI